MEFTARLTKDAIIKKTKDDRTFVAFSVVINDSYKSKGVEQPIKTALYIDCSYWLSTKIAPFMKKGSIIEVTGRLYLNAYQSAAGEAKASLNCHVNSIKLHSSPKELNNTPTELSLVTTDPSDDLPF